MCKLLIMTGIKDSPKAVEFMARMAAFMSYRNGDGIGYTAVKPDGSMFAERWHNNEQFFNHNPVMKKVYNYNNYGDVDLSDVKTVTMHTRYATCGKEFKNTHPFIYNDTSLVHNGVISNAEALKVNKISTCDSEAALQTFLNEGVDSDTEKAKGWLDLLNGSYAFGILSRAADGQRVLDVVRGSSWLYFMEIKDLGIVFTTDKDDAIAVTKFMGLEFITTPDLLSYNSMFRFNAVTGELIKKVDVAPVSKYEYGNKSWRNPSSGNVRSMSNIQMAWDEDMLGYEDQKDLVESKIDREEPDIFLTDMSDFDPIKVKKYIQDEKEPLLDRLDIYDLVYDMNLAEEYEEFTADLREYIQETDFMQGFDAAAALIRDLVQTKQAK